MISRQYALGTAPMMFEARDNILGSEKTSLCTACPVRSRYQPDNESYSKLLFQTSELCTNILNSLQGPQSRYTTCAVYPICIGNDTWIVCYDIIFPSCHLTSSSGSVGFSKVWLTICIMAICICCWLHTCRVYVCYNIESLLLGRHCCT